MEEENWERRLKLLKKRKIREVTQPIFQDLFAMCRKALLSSNGTFEYFLNDWVLNEVIKRRSWMSIFPEIKELRREIRNEKRKDKYNIIAYESEKGYPFKYVDIPSVSGKSILDNDLKFEPYYGIDCSTKLLGECTTLGEKITEEILCLKGGEFLKRLTILRYADGLLEWIEKMLDNLSLFEEDISKDMGIFGEIDHERFAKILTIMGFQNNPIGVLLEHVILKAGKA